ncbi:MAG: FAD-binding oxidoreductase [Candidatus Paceibacterota bacterium]
MDIKQITKETGVTVRADEKTRDTFSRDTSLFQVHPEAVVFPESSEDVEKIVSYVARHKEESPYLSVTGRSAGTDMTGGPLNDSLIMSCTEHLNAVIELGDNHAVVQPGVYYQDFEKKLTPDHLTMPVYPASKSIAALGGMVMNNCGGEKTLRYGQMRDFVNAVKMVLADGKEYLFGPMNRDELERVKQEDNFIGDIYRRMHALLEDNYDLIKAAKPSTTKNSSGYALWDVWDRETDVFDMSQLFVGSQGTLGMMTEANVRLIRKKPHTRLVSVFFKDWDAVPDLVNQLLPLDPDSLEAFDDQTLKLGLRFMPEIARKVGSNFFSFALKFLPEAWIGVKMLGMPKLILLIELAEDTEEELNEKTAEVEKILEGFAAYSRTLYSEPEQEKYWVMRRQSFNLLRQHVKGKQTAPFVEDFCIAPEDVPEFLPQAIDILEGHDIAVNIAGHAGNGNFHIIPLMDLTTDAQKDKIMEVAEEFYDLVLAYSGTITAEHNDGIVRTPFLEKMYGEEVYALFEEVKKIFDPQNIFNPGKKVGGTKAYARQHIKAKNHE